MLHRMNEPPRQVTCRAAFVFLRRGDRRRTVMPESDPMPLARRELVVAIPASDVRMRRDIPFTGSRGDALKLDVYSPPAAHSATPAVVIASGYRDADFRSAMGCSFK